MSASSCCRNNSTMCISCTIKSSSVLLPVQTSGITPYILHKLRQQFLTSFCVQIFNKLLQYPHLPDYKNHFHCHYWVYSVAVKVSSSFSRCTAMYSINQSIQQDARFCYHQICGAHVVTGCCFLWPETSEHQILMAQFYRSLPLWQETVNVWIMAAIYSCLTLFSFQRRAWHSNQN